MAVSFLINKSQGLKFLDTYKEEFTPTNYFSATKEQFYDNSYNPNEAQGLSDMSLWFFPMGKIGGSVVKETGGMIYEGSKVILQKGSNKVSSLAIPTTTVGLSDYANAPTSSNDKLYSGPTDASLIIIGGLLANQVTKMLSQTILKQNAKTSIKYGLEAGVFDGALQIGSQITDQMIDVGGSVDFRKISLDWDNISRSIISGAVIAPNFFDSSKTIIHSWKAKQNLKNQLKDAKTINRQNKIQGRIDKNNNKLKNHIYFQTTNKMLNKAIDYEVENLQGDNK